jgi:hypothetical protein
MPPLLRKRSKIVDLVVTLGLWLAATAAALAHPGSAIVVDAQGQIYFVDTGQGVWKLDQHGKLALIHARAFHWMALDEKGAFAKSRALGDFDNGSFERITPAASVPALIISSDYPVAVGQDGGLYYVPYNNTGRRELVRRMPDGQRSVFATLPTATSPKPMRWANGIAADADGSLYITDNDAVRKINRGGAVSTFRDAIQAPDCADPLTDAPQLPYLRGLAVARDGTIYAAANGCRAVIAIRAEGAIKTVLKAEPPWSPTALVTSGRDLYVLEYVHTPGDNRKEWIPRVRKIAADGRITTLATVERQKN